MDLLTVTVFFIILGLAFGLTLYALKKWLKKQSEQDIIYGLLIGWIIWGFISKLDNSQQFGCFITSDSIFTINNLIYSGIPLCLLTISFFTHKKQIKTNIIISEFLFWTYKLFFIKGGYALGIAAIISIEVVLFDCIALILHLALLKLVFNLKLNTTWVVLPSFIIMLVKIYFFR